MQEALNTNTPIHTPKIHHQGQFGVQYPVRGYFNTWTGGARNWTTNLLIDGQAALLLEPQSESNKALKLITQSFRDDSSSFTLSVYSFLFLPVPLSFFTVSMSTYISLWPSFTFLYVPVCACGVVWKQYHMWHITIAYTAAVLQSSIKLLSNLCTMLCTVCIHGSTQYSMIPAQI